MIAVQPKSRQILGINQQAYQALRSALSLNLRRQLFIAVCDSVVLQEQLATQLEDDILFSRQLTPNHFDSDSVAPPAALASASGGTRSSAILDRLTFEPEDAHLPRQVVRWIQQAREREKALGPLQVLGIEQMTRQPAIVQNHFLRSLEKINSLLPLLDTSLLIWVSWPWLRTIQESAPNFWQWRNGVYEFVGDPTPTPVSPTVDIGRLFPDAKLPGAKLPDAKLPDAKLPNDKEAVDIHSRNQPTVSESLAATLNGEAARLSVRLHGETDDWDDLETESVADSASYAPASAINITDTESARKPFLRIVSPDSAKSSPAHSSDPSLGSSTAADAELEEAVLEGAFTEDSILEDASLDDAPLAESVLAESVLAESVPAESALAASLLEEPALEYPIPEEPILEESILDESVPVKSALETAAVPLPDSLTLSSWEQAAGDYFAVAHRRRSLIEAGDRTLTAIEPAIAAYEAGLRCVEGEYPGLGSCLNDLGTLYWLRAQQLSDPQAITDCMVHSIQLYSQALKHVDSQQEPAMVCQLYSNMGAVYSLLAAYKEPADCFRQAVIVYNRASEISIETASPQEHAMLCNSLGSVYWKLSHYDQDDKVEQHLCLAIEAYEQALPGYDPATQPLDYAAVQNNIGITYWSLAKQRSSIDLYEKAIAAYQDALTYRTPETDPSACAITHNNLALAYWDLSKENALERAQKSGYQQNAVTAFESALTIADQTSVLSETDSAAIYHCLGDVHLQSVEITAATDDIAEILQKSLHCYLQAIGALTEESPSFQPRIAAIVANLQFHYEYIGLSGQQTALNQIPPRLIPYVMPMLSASP